MFTYSKLFGCKLHKSIRVSHMALKIIDTPEFHRMRYIRQLGLCYYIYPCATHTRFEHSLGVYHLTGKVLERIMIQYPEKTYDLVELGGKVQLTQLIVECIKIAGLCHDIGHGPFSHIFDDVLLRNSTHPNRHHEIRSCLITEIICKRELSKELTNEHINFIKSLIDPKPHHTGALYQIVANKLNGVDVDKFDYLMRDAMTLGINNGFNYTRLLDEMIIDEFGDICYPKHSSLDIYDMFHARYSMHKKIYSHKTVKIIEEMLSDIYTKVNPILNISESIKDMAHFCTFTDESIIDYIELIISPPPFMRITLNDVDMAAIRDAWKLYQNINVRKLYQIIIRYDQINFDFDKFISHIISKYPDQIKATDFGSCTVVAGFTGDETIDPFKNISFYNKKESSKSFKIVKSDITCLLNNKTHEVHKYHIFKNHETYQTMMTEFENYQRSHMQNLITDESKHL